MHSFPPLNSKMYSANAPYHPTDRMSKIRKKHPNQQRQILLFLLGIISVAVPFSLHYGSILDSGIAASEDSPPHLQAHRKLFEEKEACVARLKPLLTSEEREDSLDALLCSTNPKIANVFFQDRSTINGMTKTSRNLNARNTYTTFIHTVCQGSSAMII